MRASPKIFNFLFTGFPEDFREFRLAVLGDSSDVVDVLSFRTVCPSALAELEAVSCIISFCRFRDG